MKATDQNPWPKQNDSHRSKSVVKSKRKPQIKIRGQNKMTATDQSESHRTKAVANEIYRKPCPMKKRKKKKKKKKEKKNVAKS